ncbi:hypothetical protein [Herbaspirillum aquaticum]|jgi:hypothetical protein|uniref:hypothetical protein n=1 Tax=Herbaspirillum aquaticum TaxID=568783 RepID=UPI0011318888|nr:hypothetical protein [Herbaspirillum aquaticum]
MNNATNIFRFDLGMLLSTQGADALLRSVNHSPLQYLARHRRGDWGDISSDDIQANESALQLGGRILSAYKIGEHRLWVITEADRSSTTLLLPSEY